MKNKQVVIILLTLLTGALVGLNHLFPSYLHYSLILIPVALLAINIALFGALVLSFLVTAVISLGPSLLKGFPISMTEGVTFVSLFATFSIVVWMLHKLKNNKQEQKETRIGVTTENKKDNIYINGILASYLEIMEAKDSEIKTHSMNVATYSRWIAKELKISKDKIQEIYWAGLLHDLGKTVIPSGVLNLPQSMMSDREKILFYQHATVGSEIVGQIPGFDNVAKMIHHHHEAYHSSIPIGSRILAVADAYDKLTNNKKYLKAYGSTYALEELRAGIGKEFDPLVVEALEKAIGRFEDSTLEKLA